VEDYLCTVGAEISIEVDEGNPRYSNNGLHQAYHKEDPLPE